MNDTTVRRLTGWSGVLVGVGGIATIPLYFAYSGPPPVWNVLTRNLVTIAMLMCLVVFLTGLRQLIRQSGAEVGRAGADLLATLVYGTGLVYTAVALVGVSLEAGAVLDRSGPAIDPTTTGPLADGTVLIHGSIGRALTVVMLGAAGFAVARTGVLPRWLGRAAYVVVAGNLACVPSLYFGKDAATFYSALGWGNTALTASLIVYWVLAAGVALLIRRTPANGRA
jgi:hypothetical protein